MTLRAFLVAVVVLLVLLAVGPENCAQFVKAVFAWIGTFLGSF